MVLSGGRPDGNETARTSEPPAGRHPPHGPGPGAGSWARRYGTWFALGATVVIIAVLTAALIARSTGGTTPNTSIRPFGIPANVPTPLADLMGLSPEHGTGVPAPDFTLTDQNGKTLSLSSFRGHPVVLTFFDPHCVTMCPIIAQEFVDAARRLARTDPGVVFLAVNVNRHALSVATVDAFTTEHQLETIPTWHFFTATLPTLRHVWRAYGIEVATRIVHGKWTVVHTTIDYFISPTGRERYLAAPNADYHSTPTHRAYLPGATYTAWGRGISLVAGDM